MVPYLVMAAIYIVLVLVISILVKLMERSPSHMEETPADLKTFGDLKSLKGINVTISVTSL